MATVTIHTTTRAAAPPLPYEAMASDILKKNFAVSLVFVGPTRAQKLNQTYRNRDYIPNVLAFPLDHNTGEIFITLAVAKREAHHQSLTLRQYVGFLFIHACLHLKGYEHGATMERIEKRQLIKYGLSQTSQ